MPGQPGLPNLTAMRGRRKGGTPKPQTAAPIGMAAHAAAFLETLAARHYSTASIDAHRWALRQFTGWAASRGAPDPSSYKRADLEDYQLFLHRYRSPRGGHPLAINTQIARIGCLRRFFAWLCRAGVITANPAADLDLPRKQARLLPKSLSAEEIRLLLAVPDATDPFGLRDRAILELFYATGIRRTELANLDLGDFDPCDQTLHIRRGKGGKSRMLPVGQRAATWLGSYLGDSRPRFDHLPGETAMFLSGYGTRITPVYLGNWIKKLMRRCGIDKPGACHLFRHSCATDMHRGGADIRYVQEMLGHARLETTQIYTHVHIDALRAVHARTHPHGTADIGGSSDFGGEIAGISDNEGDFASNSYIGSLSTPLNMSALAHPSPPTAAVTVARRQIGCPKPPGEEPPPENALPRTPNSPKDPAGGNSHNPLMSSDLDKRESLSNSASLVYYGYRFYDPNSGRWPSRDPIGEEGGINLYGFAWNAPTFVIDILGWKAYMICNRCKGTSGPMRCIAYDDKTGATSPPFTTNEGENRGRTPEGKYKLEPKPNSQMEPDNRGLPPGNIGNGKVNGPGGWEFPQGTPSVTRPGLKPGQPNSGFRPTVRVHGPGFSLACITTDQCGRIQDLMEDNEDDGGMDLEINDVCCEKGKGPEDPAPKARRVK